MAISVVSTYLGPRAAVSTFFPSFLLSPLALVSLFGTSVPRLSCNSGAGVLLGDSALGALFIH